MARPATDASLRQMEGAKPRKRTSKDRSKPNPPENFAAGRGVAREFADGLSLMPGLVTEERNGTWQVQAPHNDDDLWILQLVQTFGTRSTAMTQTFSVLCSRRTNA
ncbi:MAG: hypothetical protein AAGI28_03615 [Pseudomonadota bacterium]